MKKAVRFKYTKNCIARTRNLPDFLLDLGLKNGQKVGIKYGALKANETPMYYFMVGPRAYKLQSTDGLVTGLSQFFEVIE